MKLPFINKDIFESHKSKPLIYSIREITIQMM